MGHRRNRAGGADRPRGRCRVGRDGQQDSDASANDHQRVTNNNVRVPDPDKDNRYSDADSDDGIPHADSDENDAVSPRLEQVTRSGSARPRSAGGANRRGPALTSEELRRVTGGRRHGPTIPAVADRGYLTNAAITTTATNPNSTSNVAMRRDRGSTPVTLRPPLAWCRAQ